MNLNQTILDAARDEVAREYGFNSWSGAVNGMLTHISNEERLLERYEQAALLAMEKQAGFFRWASQEYWYADNVDRWISVDDLMRENQITELELYNIWREGK